MKLANRRICRKRFPAFRHSHPDNPLRDQRDFTQKSSEIKHSKILGRDPIFSRDQINYNFSVLFGRHRNTNSRSSAKRCAVLYCYRMKATKIIRFSITTVGRANGGGGGGVKSIRFSPHRRSIQRSCGRTDTPLEFPTLYEI